MGGGVWKVLPALGVAGCLRPGGCEYRSREWGQPHRLYHRELSFQPTAMGPGPVPLLTLLPVRSPACCQNQHPFAIVIVPDLSTTSYTDDREEHGFVPGLSGFPLTSPAAPPQPLYELLPHSDPEEGWYVPPPHGPAQVTTQSPNHPHHCPKQVAAIGPT